jgi:hypothetical protein
MEHRELGGRAVEAMLGQPVLLTQVEAVVLVAQQIQTD